MKTSRLYYSPPTRLLCLLTILILGSWSARAQINISLKSSFRHYLRYEPIDLEIQLRNYSGNTLVFSGKDGPSRGYLRFIIATQDGHEARCTNRNFNPVEDLILGAGETKRLQLSINTFFDLQKEGTYNITAQLGHARLPNDYRSQPITIDVREGLPVITRNIGLPACSSGQDIKAIRVTLLLFHDGNRELYCLRAEDDEAVYGTVRLGQKITGAKPFMDADAASDIHVLIQLQSRLFVYAVYSLCDTGIRLRERQYFKPDAYGPRLTRAPGYLKVVGGIPAKEGVDVQIQPPGKP